MQDSLTCPSCRRELPVGASFCGFDGSSLIKSAQFAIYRRCPQCLSQLPGYVSYCPHDGSRLPIASTEPGDQFVGPRTLQLQSKTEHNSGNSDQLTDSDSGGQCLWG